MPTPKEATTSGDPKLSETSIVAFDVAFVDTAAVVTMSDGDPVVNRHDVWTMPAGTTSLRSKEITLAAQGVTLEEALTLCAQKAAEEMGSLPTTPRTPEEIEADGLGPITPKKRARKAAPAKKAPVKKTTA